jgi:hypothetical protein
MFAISSEMPPHVLYFITTHRFLAILTHPREACADLAARTNYTMATRKLLGPHTHSLQPTDQSRIDYERLHGRLVEWAKQTFVHNKHYVARL